MGDETYKLHQIYNLQSSCKIGTRAGQVSPEIHSLSAMHKNLQGQSQNEIEKRTLEILQFPVHSGVRFHRFDYFHLSAAGSLKKRLMSVDPGEMRSIRMVALLFFFLIINGLTSQRSQVTRCMDACYSK